jgi:asparagine synthase (glutamine-hydrolysing)
MCGISGFYGKDIIPLERIKKTLSLMENRGPDNQDYICYKNSFSNVYLLHSRLSIIDLNKRANQPFKIGHLTIIFNGEIYNYLELKNYLISKGIKLKTKSDTEVLLYYYYLYEDNCVKYFEGMWAFAIFDSKKNKLFLSRDRFGEKPLYIYQSEDTIFFASEIKFIISLSGKNFGINYNKINDHLYFGYKSLHKNNSTFYKKIYEIESGECLTIVNNKNIKKFKYWAPTINTNKNISLNEAIEIAREKLINSVKIRLRSDVKMAFELSGGVDSSSIASIAVKQLGCKIKTFSIIDRDERYNEEKNILRTVKDLKCDYDFLTIDNDNDHLRNLIKFVNYHDAPLATINSYYQSLLQKRIHKKGYKITFSGEASDEIFSGYYNHFLFHLSILKKNEYKVNHDNFNNFIAKNIRNPHLKDFKAIKKNKFDTKIIFDDLEETKKFFKINSNFKFEDKYFSKNLFHNRMLNELFYETVPVSLHEHDLNSMMFSIENRSPFLDTNLINFMNTVPRSFLIQNGYGKYILRESMKGILNDHVRLDREKKGFNGSIFSLFDFSKKSLNDFLFNNNSIIYDIVNKREIMQLTKKKFLKNSLNKFLFNFINIKIFLDINNKKLI